MVQKILSLFPLCALVLAHFSSAQTSPAPKSVNYKGCYTDNTSSRSLPVLLFSQSNTTIETCQTGCQANNYTITGLEYSSECWCGSTLAEGAQKEADDSTCNDACSGDAAEACGGANRLSIYSELETLPQNSKPHRVPQADGFALQGCYADSVSNRVLPVRANGGSAETCAKSCTEYKYMGLEYSSECYCGNKFTPLSGDKAGSDSNDGSCDQPCSNNSTESCGGPNRILLYAQNLPAPTQQPANYQGCYAEPDGGRALPYRADVPRDANDAAHCEAACTAANYTIAGTEYSSECWCGNYINSTLAVHDDSQCNMQCSGNPNENCGGPNRLSVYSKSTPMDAPTAQQPATLDDGSTFVGCLKDQPDRTLPHFVQSSSSMTLESCSASCQGYTYFGTEYSSECYCGNDVTGVDKLPQGSCGMTCSGNQAEFCGGSFALSVYQLNVPGDASSGTQGSNSSSSDPTSTSNGNGDDSTMSPTGDDSPPSDETQTPASST